VAIAAREPGIASQLKPSSGRRLMLRFNASSLLLWCVVGVGCSTDIPPDAIESSASALGAAGQVASASNTIDRECGPGARQPQCPRPQVCELARHERIGQCRNPVVSAPHCGNSIVEAGEACDDGNQSDADGCSSACQKDDNAATPGDDRAGYAGQDLRRSGGLFSGAVVSREQERAFLRCRAERRRSVQGRSHGGRLRRCGLPRKRHCVLRMHSEHLRRLWQLQRLVKFCAAPARYDTTASRRARTAHTRASHVVRIGHPRN
jgi:cysteine-rich repeat protein